MFNILAYGEANNYRLIDINLHKRKRTIKIFRIKKMAGKTVSVNKMLFSDIF